MDTKTLDYFSGLNSLAKKVVGDVQLVQQMFGDEWETMDWKRQEHILDDYFVDPNTRKKYENHGKQNEYAKSFPRLTIQSGEKIVVEMENDFWTWQDEHSAPFSWKSKSQQDLTLLDLEPEQMSKPLSAKNRKGSQGSLGEEIKISNVAPQEFLYKPGDSLWYSTFPAALKKLNDMPATAGNLDKSLNQLKMNKADKSPEEINYAFKDSCQDITITNGEILHSNVESNLKKISEEEPVAPPRKSKTITKPSVKPPAPPTGGKVKLASPSFSKKDKVDSEVLMKPNKPDEKEENNRISSIDNAFDNPGLVKDWTHAVEGDSEGQSSNSSSPSRKPLWTHAVEGDSEGQSSSGSSPSRKPLLSEPVSQTMDRQNEKLNVSKYENGFSETEDSQSLLNTTESQDEELNTAYIEHDTIKMDLNRHFNMTEELDLSDVRKTGFDFLDNW